MGERFSERNASRDYAIGEEPRSEVVVPKGD